MNLDIQSQRFCPFDKIVWRSLLQARRMVNMPMCIIYLPN